MPSLRARIVKAATSAYFSTIDARKADVRGMRRYWHAFANVLWSATRVTITKGSVADRHCEWLTPQEAAPDKLLLYWHGGAYCMGNCATHRQMASYIAKQSGVRLLLPEYRLAPEHPFPAAVEDSVRVYRALLDEGCSPGDIVVAGDSAGGGLTMAMLLSLRNAGEPLPASACLLSPWLDLAATGESMSSKADRDPWFQPEDMPVVAAYYCDEDERRHPLVSPVYADLGGLPPLYIQVGSDEILLSDSTRAADKVIAAGGDVELEIWPDMWHVFQAFVHQMPESRQAIAKIGAYVRHSLRLPPLSES